MPCLGLLCTRCTGTCVDLGYHSGCSEIKSSKHKVFKKNLSLCKFYAKHIRQAFVCSVEDIVTNRWACLLDTLTGGVRRHKLRWIGIWRTQIVFWVGATEWHLSFETGFETINVTLLTLTFWFRNQKCHTLGFGGHKLFLWVGALSDWGSLF